MEYDLTKQGWLDQMGMDEDEAHGKKGSGASSHGKMGSGLGISGQGIGVAHGIMPKVGPPPMGHPWGTGIGIGIGQGWPNSVPYDPWTQEKADWEDMQRQKAKQWDLAKIIADKQRQDEMDRILHGKLIHKGEADRKAQEAQEHARGIEAAETALGARHYFRQALQAGHRLGLIRCWSAACERGFDADLLSKGISETLITAALGKDPVQALGWLAEEGFKPSRAVASQAMLAMFASGQARPAGLSEIIGLFGAGTLEPKALAAIEAASKGLSSRALANAEAYEMEQLAGKGREAGKAARL